MTRIPRLFSVVVGNVGTVYSGDNERVARKEKNDWIRISRGSHHRASGEPVTLFCDGEIIAEHPGRIEG